MPPLRATILARSAFFRAGLQRWGDYPQGWGVRESGGDPIGDCLEVLGVRGGDVVAGQPSRYGDLYVQDPGNPRFGLRALSAALSGWGGRPQGAQLTAQQGSIRAERQQGGRGIGCEVLDQPRELGGEGAVTAVRAEAQPVGHLQQAGSRNPDRIALGRPVADVLDRRARWP